jgi:hypothetical protein
MKYAIEMGSGAIIFLPISIKIGSESMVIAHAYFNFFKISKQADNHIKYKDFHFQT